MLILWLFPILFIIHDIEEITGFEKWYIKNKDKFNKNPKITNIIGYVFSYFKKKNFALAILEELILIIIVCLITINYDFYLLWIGGFIAYTFHLIIHIFQSIILKMYVPANDKI
ncbi:HXXEE domain-containing protein [Oceanivirga salmonicida]|uniref:HXXEE domain-containing protein n=1 Tax=Oceanivirga salmonicida TaxID=1769291 RepID=UPI0008377E9C|nr:HXXEE domain-containing protein [Oceanivirga salmonicida]